ncbi:methylated-DNA--[protein]-cysteine S-methyltransferase [Ornithinibacillus halophilus]|uniref:methylated-DNA--[protein]-cysteine S-methyltransferase n=1 Tax=Ornithinibacillus halophilus TaxID=930117 RepID=A0A1M5HWC8_9BACI|nr:methylated-DNA--[protein]-cysteine S-methyltransferase [Ornithinibacillus halophilus]SHG20219.1 methylated-DNA-[protein]-cysteine S-methyltransferase/epoxyqueuosine reductase [Ornithinibacillus halophilus]
MVLFFDEFETPVGTMMAMSNGEHVVRLEYGTLEQFKKSRMNWLDQYFKNSEITHDPSYLEQVTREVNEYFQMKRKEFSFDFMLYGTSFQKKVWQALFDTIRFGDTKSYKDIANTIENPKAVRAVGGAVNKNPISIAVPCHRVIGANGKLVGYNGGLDKKTFLLEHESMKL